MGQGREGMRISHAHLIPRLIYLITLKVNISYK